MRQLTKPGWGDLERTLSEQEQVISRGEALACGLSRSQIRHRIRPRGPWQPLLPGVYLAATGTPTRRQTEIAALRCAGPGSVITGIAALRHHGVRVPESATITVLVPAKRPRQSRSYVHIWPTTRMPDQVFGDGAIRFTQAARAVTDAARELPSFRAVRAVAADAIQRRRCWLEQLTEELAQAPVRQSAWLRQATADVAEGIRSAAEGDFLDLTRRARLPVPIFNARLFAGETLIAVADAWWPEAGVAVEVESREWHLSPEDWERTLRRSARMSAHGIIVLHFTPHQIRAEATRVVADITSALRVGRERPALAIRAFSPTDWQLASTMPGWQGAPAHAITPVGAGDAADMGSTG
jgi:hypothetical protein